MYRPFLPPHKDFIAHPSFHASHLGVPFHNLGSRQGFLATSCDLRLFLLCVVLSSHIVVRPVSESESAFLVCVRRGESDAVAAEDALEELCLPLSSLSLGVTLPRPLCACSISILGVKGVKILQVAPFKSEVRRWQDQRKNSFGCSSIFRKSDRQPNDARSLYRNKRTHLIIVAPPSSPPSPRFWPSNLRVHAWIASKVSKIRWESRSQEHELTRPRRQKWGRLRTEWSGRTQP